MKVKDALKRFRREFQLKQVEVAKILGIRPQSYQLYEYGKVSPSIPIILKLADTSIGIIADDFITSEE